MSRMGLYQITVQRKGSFWADGVSGRNAWADNVRVRQDGATVLSQGKTIVAVAPPDSIVSLLWWEDAKDPSRFHQSPNL